MRPMILLASFFLATMAWAAPTSSAYVICKLKGNVRTLHIEMDGNNICHAHYSKEGVDKVVGSGKSFLQNIQLNLGKSNWTCRDVASSTVSDGR
jgi:hypothetical protein